MGILEGKVVLVTGAAGGIGKECALIAAKQGAKVVVNDLGGSVKGGDAGDASAAQKTVNEIKAAGGEAVANSDSVSLKSGAENMIAQALDTYGALHSIISPAGILRDGMFHKMPDEDWDAVLEVHLKGSYNITRAAINHFREKEEGNFLIVAHEGVLKMLTSLVLTRNDGLFWHLQFIRGTYSLLKEDQGHYILATLNRGGKE